MATEDIVGGLFGINPAMYQQQQQKQVFDRAVALQNLDPFQQAAVGYQQAGYNLAGALGGALGGVDPQLQRISALNAISKQIDQSNPESIMSGAKMLADAGFTQEALGLAQYARKANSELALAKQRMNEGRAATVTKDIQNAEYAANLRVVLGELESGPQTADTPRQIALIKARLEALPQQKEASTTTDAIKNATALADASGFTKGTTEYNKVYKDALTGLTAKAGKEDASTNEIRNALAIADASGFAKGTPEYSKAYKDALAVLTAKPEKADATTNEIKNATAVADLSGFAKGTLEYNKVFKDELARLTAKPGKEVSSTEAIKNALALADASGFAKDSPEYNKAYKDALTELTGKPGKADATTNEIRNALAFADLSGFAKDTLEYNKVFKDELARLTAKPAAPVKEPPSVGAEAERISLDEFGVNYYALTQEQRKIVNQRVDAKATKADRAPPSVGADAERISLEKFGKNYYDLTPDQRAAVNKIVDAKEPSGKVSITNVLPGTEKLVDIPAFRSSVQRTIEPQLKIIDATDTALAAIDDSIATNNFSSFRAAQTQFARAISGGGDLSQKELLAAGADPAILGGTADYLSKLVSGTPTLDTQNKIRNTLLAIRKVSLDKARGEIKQQRIVV